MKKLRLLVVVFSFMLASTAALASVQRLESWGSGASEFDAVKAAYKTLMADSLKLLAGSAATNTGSLRRGLERELEEDLLKTKRVFFPDASESCERKQETVDCLVVAAVRMDELEAWTRENIATVGRGANRVANIRFALMAKPTDDNSQDFLRWLHSELEQDFGHDIYLSETYISPNTIREGCDEYRQLAEKFKSRGDSYQRSVRAYRNNYSVCKDLVDRDVIIVIDDLSMQVDPFNTRDKSIGGRVRVALKFIRTSAKRPLPAPKPRAISQHGYGANRAAAEAELRDRLYESTANYISQQFNDIVIVSLKKDKVNTASTSKNYEVAITGVDSDSAEGREKLRFVRNWFAQTHGIELTVDYDRGGFGENIHVLVVDRELNWTPIVDQLYNALDEKSYPARIDIDRNHNMTLAFKGDGKAADRGVKVAINAKSIKRKIKVKSSDMVLRRRDPATGIALALNEANIKLYNSSRSDLYVAVSPVWYGESGVNEPSPYSEQKVLIIKAKSERNFIFRAPNKYATSVSLEIDCPGKTCKVAN